MNTLKLSFPPRILAAILAVVVGAGGYIIAHYVARGTVTFTSSHIGAYVVDVKTEIKYDMPATLTLRSGKRVFHFAAPGYADKEEVVVIPTFRQTKTVAITLEKALYSEENPESIKNVPLAAVLPHVENGVFAVEFPTEAGVYEIGLRPNPNWFPNDKAYREGLKQAKQRALAWIQSHNVNPASLNIKWVPYDPDAK